MDVDGVYEDKTRICVVTRVTPEFVEVVYGQGTAGTDPKPIEVLLGSPEGDEFGLRKDTFFRSSNVKQVEPSRLQRKIGLCNRRLFDNFRELVDNFHRRIARGE